MNNLVKFANWATKNGYGNTQIPFEVIIEFEQYLNYYENEVKNMYLVDACECALTLAEWLIKNKFSNFIDADIPKDDKIIILNALNYSENMLD